MSTSESLAKLQALLERIRARTRVPAAAPVPGAATAPSDGRERAVPRGAAVRAEGTAPSEVSLRGRADAPGSGARPSDSDERLRAPEAIASEPEIGISIPPSEPSGADEPSFAASAVAPDEPTRTMEALDEDEERAPASSKRPVALASEDHLAQMAFEPEESSAPHHTPPPESGRLPSVSVDDFDDGTGIRVEETGRKVISHLAAESTRANLRASDAVVDAVGEARRFAPTTFLALLQASLEL